VNPTLPPARERRGQLILSGRLDPRDAHPLEIAFATRHILTHPNLDADAWRRSHEDQALAELRASLGNAPWVYFGLAALKAVHTRLPETACRRCRANMLAKVYKLRPPGFDEATSYLLGPPCDLCRPRSAETRVGDAVRTSSAATVPAPPTRLTPSRPTREKIADWLLHTAARDAGLSTAVRKLLGGQSWADPARGIGLDWHKGLPPISDQPVARGFKR
jgi:hypothetical protein